MELVHQNHLGDFEAVQNLEQKKKKKKNYTLKGQQIFII
jgi:hypothetical protein